MNQKHFSLVCKQKHMLKNGAPPHEFKNMYHLFPIEVSWFLNGTDFLWFSTVVEIIV